MILTGKILDLTTGAPIPGASVRILTPDGNYTGIGAAADGSGNFSLNSLQAEYPNYIAVTSVGYNSVSEQLYPDFNLDWNGIITLQKSARTLPPVTVTAGKSNNNAWLLLLIPVILAAAKKKKAMGATVGKIDSGTIITIGLGVVMLKGFSLFNDLLDSLGLGKDPTKPDATNPDSPWQPDYYHKHGTAYISIILEGQRLPEFQEYAKTIYNAFAFFGDNFTLVQGIFNQLNSKCEVSFLSAVFTNYYGYSLLSYLKDGKSSLPWNGLSTSQLNTLIAYVNNLPVQ